MGGIDFFARSGQAIFVTDFRDLLAYYNYYEACTSIRCIKGMRYLTYIPDCTI